MTAITTAKLNGILAVVSFVGVVVLFIFQIGFTRSSDETSSADVIKRLDKMEETLSAAYIKPDGVTALEFALHRQLFEVASAKLDTLEARSISDHELIGKNTAGVSALSGPIDRVLQSLARIEASADHARAAGRKK